MDAFMTQCSSRPVPGATGGRRGAAGPASSLLRPEAFPKLESDISKMCMLIYIYMYTYIMCTCICVYIYMYNMQVSVYIHISVHTYYVNYVNMNWYTTWYYIWFSLSIILHTLFRSNFEFQVPIASPRTRPGPAWRRMDQRWVGLNLLAKPGGEVPPVSSNMACWKMDHLCRWFS